MIEEGGQALIIAVRICAQSVRSLCACAQPAVEVLGFFLFAHSNAHRLLCSQLRTAAHSCAQTSVRICARLCASVRIHTILFCAHLCAFGAHAHHHYMLCAMRTAIAHRHSMLCAFCAHSVRMLTDVCAQRTDTSCAHSVRIAHRRLWKFYPLSVRSAPNAHRCAPLVHLPLQS